MHPHSSIFGYILNPFFIAFEVNCLWAIACVVIGTLMLAIKPDFGTNLKLGKQKEQNTRQEKNCKNTHLVRSCMRP